MEKPADVYRPTFLHYAVVLPAYVLLRLLLSSLRFRPSKNAAKICSAPERLVGVAWHRNIIFLAKAKLFFRPKFDMAGLVSASKDAAYLVAFFNLIGIKSVRGSHKRRGREAVGDLVKKLGSDCDVFITPDGPRGPACVAKKGFFVVSEASGIRVLVMRFRPDHFIALPTWDGFVLPMPFTKVRVEAVDFESAQALSAEALKAGKTPEEFVSDYMNFK